MVYIKVLQYLNDKGLYVEVDIMPLFYDKSCDEVFEIVKPIIEQGHIGYILRYDNVTIDKYGGQTPGDIIGLTCHITFSGMDFLIKHSLFQRTKNSMKTQFVFSIVSGLLLALSIYVSASLIKADNSVHGLLLFQQQEIQNIKTELHKVQDSLSTLNKASKPLLRKKP